MKISSFEFHNILHMPHLNMYICMRTVAQNVFQLTHFFQKYRIRSYEMESQSFVRFFFANRHYFDCDDVKTKRKSKQSYI